MGNESRVDIELAIVCVGLIAVCAGVSCGRFPGSHSAASEVSTTPIATSQSPTSVAVLRPGDCTQQLSVTLTTTTKSLGMDSITLTVPSTWTNQTNNTTGDSVLLLLQAPTSYGSDRATFLLESIPGPRRGSTSHEQAIEDAAGQQSGTTATVSDCTVAGEQASFYEYRDSAGNDVYRLLILHSPTSRYPFLYVAVISSKGLLDPSAIAAVRGMLGSWRWGPPQYDPNS